MRVELRRPVAIVTAWAISWFTIPGNLQAQEQIIPASQLHTELQKAAQSRQANLATLERVLASDAAQQRMKAVRLDPAQVRTAVSQLDDRELQRLAQMAAAAETDMAAGLFGTLFTLLAIIGAIVVIIFILRAVD